MKQRDGNPSRQSGAALVIGLILLLVMTLLGVTAMRGTTLQERMSGALSDQNVAFQSAETALRQGEDLLASVTAPNFNAAGWYDQDDGKERPEWPENATDVDDIGDGVITYKLSSGGGAGGSDMGWSEPPEFYIERMPPVVITGSSGASKAIGDGTVKEEYELYRVVARGFGKNQTTVAVVESIYRR